MTPSAPWPGVLDFPEDKFAELMEFVEEQRRREPDQVWPRADEMFAAFALTPYDEVKVVLLGQDPYPNPAHAMGLSFSVRRHVTPLPASLRSINMMMELDGLRPLSTGDLTSWGTQGVLLLNTALTVRTKAGTHLAEWREFTQRVIELLSEREDPMVFLLWGVKAQWWQRFIDTERHRVVTAPHPAVRGTHPTAFHTSRSFSRVNEELEALGKRPVRWEIGRDDL